MKIALITTIRHNIGDDFVRDGIVYLLEQVLGTIDVSPIHKHFPASVRREWAWLHGTGLTRVLDRIPGVDASRCSRVIERLPVCPALDKILDAELVIQCGAPVYWLHPGSDCAQNEWYGPLIRRRWQRVRARVPLLNLGAGSCQAYHSDGREFAGAPRVLEYIRTLYAECALTTVRDRLSSDILAFAGVTAPLLPCPSLFARKLHGLVAEESAYVALNFMPLGGHYLFAPKIDPAWWRDTFVGFARQLARHERCLLVCHDREELAQAERFLPEIPRFHARDHREYLRAYARASVGVVNRVHAAFALASFGRPAVVVGNDSRARMVEMLGTSSLYLADATVERLQAELTNRRRCAVHYAQATDVLAGRTEDEYVRLLTGVLRAKALF